MLRAMLAIGAKDLRQRLRDRSALVMGFFAPLAIAALMNAAFSGAETFHADLALVDADGGPIATAVGQMFDDPDLQAIFTVRRLDREEAATAVADGDLDAALVIPAGFSAAATGSDPAHLEVLTSVNAGIAGQVVEGLARGVANRIETTRLAVAAAGDAQLAAAAADAPPIEQVVDRPIGAQPMTMISYFAPAMGIFFVLFSVSLTARNFFTERATGTLDRMVAAPVPAGAVLAGKAIAAFVFSVGSLGMLLLVATVAFGARWGSPWAVAALCLAMSCAVVAVTMVVIVLARTERQAQAVASIVTFGLALAGGNFLFVSGSPEVLRRLALATPNGWALRGFTDLATGVPATEAVGLPLLAIAAFTVPVAAVAVALSRRVIAT